MEPTIPVGSLVIDRCLDDEDEIKENTIISFNVDRLGDDVIFTHYFKKKEVDESGKERYYTQAENADRYDDYKTYREDILGTYMFHIPVPAESFCLAGAWDYTYHTAYPSSALE